MPRQQRPKRSKIFSDQFAGMFGPANASTTSSAKKTAEAAQDTTPGNASPSTPSFGLAPPGNIPNAVAQDAPLNGSSAAGAGFNSVQSTDDLGVDLGTNANGDSTATSTSGSANVPCAAVDTTPSDVPAERFSSSLVLSRKVRRAVIKAQVDTERAALAFAHDLLQFTVQSFPPRWLFFSPSVLRPLCWSSSMPELKFAVSATGKRSHIFHL